MLSPYRERQLDAVEERLMRGEAASLAEEILSCPPQEQLGFVPELLTTAIIIAAFHDWQFVQAQLQQLPRRPEVQYYITSWGWGVQLTGPKAAVCIRHYNDGVSRIAAMPLPNTDRDPCGPNFLFTLQDFDKNITRNIYPANLFHFFLPLFLFIQEFIFARYITAIKLGGDIFAKRGNALGSNNCAANGRLNFDFKILAGD